MQSVRNLIRKFNQPHKLDEEQLGIIEQAIRSANSKERKMRYMHARVRWRSGDKFISMLEMVLR